MHKHVSLISFHLRIHCAAFILSSFNQYFNEISPTLAGPFVMAIPEFLLTLKAVANQEVIESGTVEEIITEPLALKARSNSYVIM